MAPSGAISDYDVLLFVPLRTKPRSYAFGSSLPQWQHLVAPSFTSSRQ